MTRSGDSGRNGLHQMLGVLALLFFAWFLGSGIFVAVAAITLWDTDRGAVAVLMMLASLGVLLMLALFSIISGLEKMTRVPETGDPVDDRRPQL